jgi:cytidyltransferase-like protein
MKTGVILARFQPIHNGHLQLIKKACDENEQVLVIIGSIDKLSKRNPIPWTIRKQLVEKAIKDHSLHEKRECNLNSVWFLFLLNHNKYNFFFLDLQMLLKVVFGCVQGRQRMSRLYTLAHIRELPFLCV